MLDLLSLFYPWTKALHVMAVISWMAGLFYLPRLFVYHVENGQGPGEPGETFAMMERRLLRLIMNPAMILTWFFGLALVVTPGIVDWASIWPWTKAVGVLWMTWFHHWLAKRRKDLAAGTNRVSARSYRLMNEFPTLLMAIIVFSVILKF